MREAVIDRLYTEFGQPAGETPTAFCWHLAPGIDLIAQTNSLPSECAVWVPCRGAHRFPGFCDCFDASRNRPTESYHQACPALAQGGRVCRVTVRNQSELDTLVAEIHRRKSPGPPDTASF